MDLIDSPHCKYVGRELKKWLLLWSQNRMKIVVFKKNASMIHSVVNIQFGFVDLLVGFLDNAHFQPCWHAQPHNFCLFVFCCLFIAVVDRPTCVLELHAPSKYAVKVNCFKKPIFFISTVKLRVLTRLV